MREEQLVIIKNKTPALIGQMYFISKTRLSDRVKKNELNSSTFYYWL